MNADERKRMFVSAGIIVAGLALWLLGWILSISVSSWGNYVPRVVADGIGELNFLYQTAFAPGLSLALIGISAWLIVGGLKRFRDKPVLILLAAIGFLLPALFLIRHLLGLFLLATMDF